MSSVGDLGSPTDPGSPVNSSSKARLQSPLDFRNGDLVSRLLAATPPYLYNMPLVPHSFFFSEMLRSFVQAKTDNNSGGGQMSPPGGGNSPRGVSTHQPRRGRKRTWRESSVERPPKIPMLDKPLELTTTSRSSPKEEHLPTSSSSPPVLPPPPPLMMPPCGLLPLPSPDTSLPPDMLLPPPPPLWYPPLYPLPPQPPYGIDPLHFFIDLRVSGHIWDRKMGKEGSLSSEQQGGSGMVTSLPDEKPIPRPPSVGPSSLVKQSKHCSAFSVPQPRGRLSPDRRESSGRGTTGTNYVLQNLSRIYQDVRGSQDKEEPADDSGKEDGGEGKPRCKDLRALIGLELVVDYVKHEGGPKARTSTPEEQGEMAVDVVSTDKMAQSPPANHDVMRQL